MRASLIIYSLIALISLTAATSDTPLEWYTENCSQLTKITEKPLKMNDSVAMLCASISPLQMLSIHSDKFYDIYVSESGAQIIKTGKGVYPENTVILKRKYSDDTGSKTELYTGMIKRAKGYNLEGGDWEYFVATGDGKTITQQGALASCMGCHQSYQSSDYVTREYFTEASSFHSGKKN